MEAHVLSKKGEYWAAIEEYTKSLSENSQHFKSLFGRAFAYGQVSMYSFIQLLKIKLISDVPTGDCISLGNAH